MTELNTSKERLNLSGRIIVFIGPEGSGKTIQAEALVRDCQMPYITTSGILHDLREHDQSELGDEVRDMFDNHRYLDGETLLRILAKRFSEDDVRNGFIVDGGLRTVFETAGFQKTLEEAGIFLPLVVVYMQIPEEVSYQRLLERQRPDDTIEGIAKRLAKFNFELEKRVDLIKSEPSWTLVEIDATPAKEVVYSAVCERLKQ